MIVQKNASKLSKTLSAYINQNSDCPIKLIDIKSDIYKIQFLNQHLKCYLFHASSLNNSILSFINEYSNQYKIYIYHDIKITHSNIFDHCHHLLTSNNDMSSYRQSVFVGHVLNNIIFSPANKNSSQHTFQSITFLNDHQPVSDGMHQIFDEQSTVVFDSPHPSVYNLGTTTEEEKNNLLNHTKRYINLTNEYMPEARLLGCEILDLNNPYGDNKTSDYNSVVDINHFISDILKM